MSAAESPKSVAPRGLLAAVETAVLCVLLFGIVALAFAQIALREVFLMSLFWADELIRLAVLWLAMIGAMVASREGRHLAIGIVPRYCPPGWHRPAAAIAMLFAAVVSALLAWQAARFVADERLFEATVLGDLPSWPFQAIMPVGFAVMAIRFARQAISSIRSGR